uniref:N-6 DNA methylase n=1 Tax=Campylobacter pinnipediorum TaxID=1965231 RepID=UPI000B157632
GVLFRGSSEEKIRKQLIDENLLDGVIGLPANLFYGTSIPACIMIFKKNRKNKDIFFIDASSEFEKEKNQNKLSDEIIEKISKVYEDRKNVDKYAYLASLDDIKENDYNLNIPRYVDTYEEEEEIDIEQSKQNIANLENELKELKAKMNESLKELGL